MNDALDIFDDVDNADIQLVWLMLFAAEHGTTIAGIPGATMLMVAVMVVGQLLGLMGLLPIAAGIIGTAAAVFVPHGCYVLAVLFGVFCILAKREPSKSDDESLIESAFTAGIELSDECPPKFCF